MTSDNKPTGAYYEVSKLTIRNQVTLLRCEDGKCEIFAYFTSEEKAHRFREEVGRDPQ
jgi:hypothetical protein